VWPINGDASLAISIVAIICSSVAIYISYKQYKLSETINILRPHSDRLSDIFRRWLSSDEALPHVFTPMDVPEKKLGELERILLSIKEEGYSLNLNPLAVEHLKTGYPEIFNQLKGVLEEIRTHNQDVLEYFLSLCNKVRNALNLPEPPYAEKFVYYSRVIIFTSEKILTGCPEGEPIIEVSLSKPRRHELKWNGATLIRGDYEDCKRGLQVIMHIKMAEAGKIRKFHKKAEELKSKIEKIFEEIRLRLVDYIKAGGIIKGRCKVCGKDAN